MTFRTWWEEGRKLIVVHLRFQPIPVWIGIDRMSVIVEIRDRELGWLLRSGTCTFAMKMEK